MIQIPLGKSKFALVDDCDIDLLYIHNWNGGSNYAACNHQGKTLYLHIEVARRMGLDLSGQIDHEDRNKLNCQRSNLRAATNSQNKMNKEGKDGTKTGFKGVHPHGRRFVAKIWKERRQFHLGVFDSAMEAAKAYNEAAQRMHGQFAVMNEV